MPAEDRRKRNIELPTLLRRRLPFHIDQQRLPSSSTSSTDTSPKRETSLQGRKPLQDSSRAQDLLLDCHHRAAGRDDAQADRGPNEKRRPHPQLIPTPNCFVARRSGTQSPQRPTKEAPPPDCECTACNKGRVD